MAERHDPNQLVGAAPDVAPLAWVIDEIRTSLSEAVNGLKAFVANKQDVDSLRNARNQVHQANGALQLLDLRGVALVTEAVEQLTRQFEADPKECLPAPVRVVETALSAVMAYLEGLLSGRPNQPLRLFPYYRDVLQLIGASRVHPADLVFPDLSRRPAFHQIEARQFTPEQLRDRRARFELGLLGFLRKADLAAHVTRIEDPVTVNYRGYTVCKCGPWTQGPVFLEQLNLLEGYDLAALGHNSPAYIHLVTEAAKLAFADRERYYGDPDFVSVPLNRLLSKEYAVERRSLIDPDHASRELRPGYSASYQSLEKNKHSGSSPGDTTHLDAADHLGNMLSATPSGGWISSSPLIEGLGFALGTRLQMFYLDPSHVNALMPGKRPRTTLTPSLVLKDNVPCLAFGTPGGDQQDQWSLQFFLNHIDFNMNIQEAADAPNFHTVHFPSSFYPHASDPGSLIVEGRIPESTRAALREKGHKVTSAGDWSNGRVLAVKFDAQSGIFSGAASARMETGYAMGW